MKINLQEIKYLNEIPFIKNKCFFCSFNAIQWISIELGVLICSNCVSTLREIGSKNGSIKLDPERTTNQIKRKVLFNFNWKNEYFHDLQSLWETRKGDIKNIQQFLVEKKDFIEKLNKLSENEEANEWYFEEDKFFNIEIDKSKTKKKQWNVVSEKEIESEKIIKINKTEVSVNKVEIKKEKPMIVKKKEESKSIRIEKETVFMAEDSSDISIDYSTNYKTVE